MPEGTGSCSLQRRMHHHDGDDDVDVCVFAIDVTNVLLLWMTMCLVVVMVVVVVGPERYVSRGNLYTNLATSDTKTARLPSFENIWHVSLWACMII